MKDQTYPILKALSAAFLVLAYSGGPDWLNHIAFLFVPALFFCQGYFFRPRYWDEERDYIKRKARRIYLPFIGWSLLFLVLHNLFYFIGFIGHNADGLPVLGEHLPYAWQEFFQRLWGVVFGMTGYDRCLCELFWVFRALMVSALLFLGITKVSGLLLPRRSPDIIVAVSTLAVFLLLVWMTLCSLTVPLIPGGGYRELCACLFMGMGHLYHSYEDHVRPKALVSILGIAAIALFSYCSPASMSETAGTLSFLSLVLPAFFGFCLLQQLGRWIASGEGILARLLSYAGDRWFYMIAFAFFAFKFSGMFILLCNGLPWSAICQYPCVGGEAVGYGWAVLNVFFGTVVPILTVWGWSILDKKYNLTLGNCLHLVFRGIAYSSNWAYRLFIRMCLSLWRSISNFFLGIKDIVKASNPHDE